MTNLPDGKITFLVTHPEYLTPGIGYDFEYHLDDGAAPANSPHIDLEIRDVSVPAIPVRWTETEQFGVAGASQALSTASPTTLTLPTGGAAAADESFIAQANVMIHVEKFKSWASTNGYSGFGGMLVKATVMDPAVNPGNATANLVGQVGEIAFAAAAAGPTPTPNTAYSTPIVHELGHLVTQELDKAGNGTDGYGEAVSDALAMLSLNTPYVGENYYGQGLALRSGQNSAQVCPTFVNCTADPYVNGLPLMGAIWDLHQAIGDDADALLIGWLNTLVYPGMSEPLRDEWLILDDTVLAGGNGNLFSASPRGPHFDEIQTAFRAHGWPTWETSLFEIAHSPAANIPLTSGSGPATVTIDATIDPAAVFTQHQHQTQLPTVFSAEVEFISPTSTQVFLMLQTGGTHDYTYPLSVSAPGLYQYRIRVTDTSGLVQHEPSNGYYSFTAGSFKMLYSHDFESTSDHGWQTLVGSQTSLPNVFERGSPAGKSGQSLGIGWHDPVAAASGSSAWGNDLGLSGLNGAYNHGEHCYLVSPTVPTPATGVVNLRFSRYLSLADNDIARILITNQAGTATSVVWVPGPGGFQDYSWGTASSVIQVPGSWSSFRVVFELQTDTFGWAGGWTVDDVQLFELVYTPGSGADTVSLIMNSTAVAGDQLVARIQAAPLLASRECVLLASSTSPVSTFQTHPYAPLAYLLQIAPTIYNLGAPGPHLLDSNGYVEIPVNQPISGPPPWTWHFEAIVLDAAGNSGEEDSNVATVSVQ